MRACSINGCDATATVADGLCSRHYQKRRRATGASCSVEGCTGGVLAKGLCSGHYTQVRAGKTIVPLVPPVVIRPGDRFGLWVVLEEVPKGNRRHRTVRVRCACGYEALNAVYTLTKGASSGCHKCRSPRRSAWACWMGAGEMSGTYWGSILAGAKTRSLDVSITKEYVWTLLLAQGRRCVLSGVPIGFDDATASLDRIDSSRGYVPENVQWVHKVINRMKGTLSDDEFKSWCRTVAAQRRP